MVQTSDPAIKAILSECNATMKAMKERLDQPIYSINTISGRGGVKYALDNFDKLLRIKIANHD